MATLFESLSQALTPDVAGQIGKIAGLDTGLVNRGMAVAGPLVTGALAKQASTPTGLDSLMRMLPTSSGAGANCGISCSKRASSSPREPA